MEQWRRQRLAFAKTRSQQALPPRARPTVVLAATKSLSSTGSGSSEWPGRSGARQGSRSIRRRECYGRVEQSERLRNCGRFRLEPRPEAGRDEDDVPSSPVLLENPQTEIRWYLRYFLGHAHRNLAGLDPATRTPFFLSFTASAEAEQRHEGQSPTSPPGSPKLPQLKVRAILWLSTGPKKLYIQIPDPASRSLLAKNVLHKFPQMADFSRGLKEIAAPKLQKDLAMLEDQEGSVNFKIGVVFRREGQTSDDAMLSNEEGSEEWEMFLRLLGQKVELRGWGSYKGGLDTTSNSTGAHSVYTRFEGHELMFHVSTLLPHSAHNPQQVERKRHIGNDIVNIVFEAGGDPRSPTFRPDFMRSQFTHVFALVTFEASSGLWRLWVWSEESVPAYGPLLPNPPTFSSPQALREFLLTKLINGERAAFQALAFTEKRHRTTDSMLKDMYMEYMKEFSQHKGLGLVGHKVSESVSKHWRGGSLRGHEKQNSEAGEFTKMGELVKLERLLSGDAPDLEASQVAWVGRKQPWEPKLLVAGLPHHDIVCSDSWGASKVLLATRSEGLRVAGPGCPDRQLVDASVSFLRIDVVESFGLFFALCDGGKHSWMSVMTLAELKSALAGGRTLSRRHLENSRIAQGDGASAYALSDSTQLRLSLAVVVGKKVGVLRWALGPLGKLPPATDLSHNLTPLAEITMEEEPLKVSLFETGPSGALRAAIASAASLHLANFSTGITTLVHRHQQRKDAAQTPAVTDLKAHWDPLEGLEVLLSYQNTTLVFDPNAPKDGLEILWTSTPTHIAYRFPFIFGFTGDTMEVRLGVNGNLLASSFVPSLRLLAAKGDLFFGSSEAAVGAGGSRAGWAVQRIAGSALSGTDSALSDASKTPQPVRHLASLNPSPSLKPSLKGRSRSRHGHGSTGSDSGVGGGRGSSSSSEGVPLPTSPLAAASSQDPFDPLPGSPLASGPII